MTTIASLSRMRWIVRSTAVVVVALLTHGVARAGSPRVVPAGSRVAADDSALARIRREYSAAYDAGDADRMGSFYTEDAVRMPYDSPSVSGRVAIVAAYRAYFATRRFAAHLELVADEVVIDGPRALERGRYHEMQQTAGGRRREDGKYVVMAVRSEAGWHYQWSIFNRDSAAVHVATNDPASGAPR